ncbi:MAG: TetR/AcrR family transcriptional regulator [Pseudomonadota bacterium]
MSKLEKRADATRRLAAHLLKTGLSQTSLRQLATAAGVSDRMLLYYFDSKADALASALGAIAGELTGTLEAAIPEGRKLPPAEMIKATSGLIRAPETKAFFYLWTETVAAAARGEEPYRTIANAIAEGFLIWIESRLSGGDTKARRATAAMILAMIDGLALLEICTDEKRAGMAAKQMETLEHPGFD